MRERIRRYRILCEISVIVCCQLSNLGNYDILLLHKKYGIFFCRTHSWPKLFNVLWQCFKLCEIMMGAECPLLASYWITTFMRLNISLLTVKSCAFWYFSKGIFINALLILANHIVAATIYKLKIIYWLSLMFIISIKNLSVSFRMPFASYSSISFLVAFFFAFISITLLLLRWLIVVFISWLMLFIISSAIKGSLDSASLYSGDAISIVKSLLAVQSMSGI